jgi:hypothetical protein
VRSRVRVSFVALIVSGLALVVISAPAAQAASFGVERFVATNCKEAFEKCGSEETAAIPFKYIRPKPEVTVAEAREQGFTEAGGRVPNGVTDFEVNTIGAYPKAVPTGIVNHVRVDVASGLATSPVAVHQCSMSEFSEHEVAPGVPLYTAEPAKCTQIGVEKITVYLGKEFEEKAGFSDYPLEAKVYNLIPPERNLAAEKGLASDYGVVVKLPTFITEAKGLGSAQYYSHSFVEGNVEWGKEAEGTDAGDYHDYFTVKVNPELPVISSRQILYGKSGEGDFITNATSCPGDDTTYVTLKDTAGETARKSFTTPIGLEGCEALTFKPGFELLSGSTESDLPNQITTEVSDFNEPGAGATGTNNPTAKAPSQVKTGSITLPPEMTLNPAAAAGLEDCTPAQARIHSEQFGVSCPVGSELGSVSLEVPTLPAGSLTGKVYLGGPESGPITGPPYVIYVVANSTRYGVSVRIKGEVVPNETTGQVTTVFQENPEQPFNNLKISFDRGVLTSIANPLICGEPKGAAGFIPVAAGAPAASDAFGVSITGCAASIPFALSQSAENATSTAGAHTSYTVDYGRADGEQYLQKIKTTLPPGLVGAIPAVTLCEEAAANAGTCGAASKIGTVTVQSGSGSSPYTFTGSAYMTGPYGGAPFGLSIVVPAIAGPFNLGNVVTRGTISINQTTAQVTAESTLPTIYKGIPLRLRSISVDVNRQGFLYNPTNCSALATESSLTSTSGTLQSSLSTPFQVEACSALAFKPVYAYSTSAKHSKSEGASLVTTVTQPAGQANIKSVLVTLPKALPSRLSTLQKACLAKTFEENPFNCRNEQKDGSEVGSAEVVTPLLPVVMKGPAFLVSHAGEEFPSLELVLEGDGVRVILEGKTHITKGITTTNFESTPDVPISSVSVKLPLGPHSALTTERLNTNLCTTKLLIPTVVTGQNGKQNKYSSVIAPTGCGVQIVGHKVVGNTAYITVETYAAGRISGGGSGLSTKYRTFTAAKKAVLIKVPLSARGRGRRRPFKVKLRVGFVPKKGAHSSATVTVKFR